MIKFNLKNKASLIKISSKYQITYSSFILTYITPNKR